MAAVDDQLEIQEEPMISPLLSRFMVISWVTLVEWELDTHMKNFEVTEFRLKKKKDKHVTCDKFPRREMALTKFDNFIVKSLLEQGCRVWFKAIGDLISLKDLDNVGCLNRGQKGFVCFQLVNKMQESKVIAYLEHQR